MHEQEKNDLIQLLISTAHMFRLAKEAEGLESLQFCIDEIEKKQIKKNNTEVNHLLYSMLTAMERRDWLSLADDIEYELSVLIKNFN